MADLNVADKFISNFGESYRELVDLVRRECDRYRNGGGSGRISDIYTRSDSTSGKFFFKETHKIVEKVRRAGKNVTPNHIFELTDIVGLTVVFYYSDHMRKGVQSISAALNSIGVSTTKPEEHFNKRGYYATHVVSTKLIAGNPIQCEIQFKTMLHDAWSAKMHDLTYKPLGLLDPRLSSMMENIAQSIQSLEEQSRIIRNMIQASWNVEEATRQAARDEIFTRMLSYGPQFRGDIVPERIQAIDSRIEELRIALENEDANSVSLQEAITEIAQCCRDSSLVRYSWILAGKIATMRTRKWGNDLGMWFYVQAEAWLTASSEVLRSGNRLEDEGEIIAVPLMFYVLGDIDRAVDISERLLDDREFASISDKTRKKIKFNRMSFLVEKEYHVPTQHPEARRAIRAEVECVLSEFDDDEFDEVKAAVVDTRGLMRIAFGETQREVREGIRYCMEATQFATGSEKSITEAYSDLNLRLGWRRYFELEALEDASSSLPD
ncbi:hypothetical protein E3C22_19345 [Jiella endophytica]|uniref:RelA/SpoT domain-containing protein n=1 Tax=Jiella endophytica TaxID=2558362 RepID=A0A4Y8REK3_9HYPH|nr:hypothetical protein [Jiella endophytica]TFF19830.1 hypothetical protein E3C22_19345 [Jiella endophytica]